MSKQPLPFSAASLWEGFQERLELKWLAGEEAATRQFFARREADDQFSPIGHLNFIHPHCIQVIGQREHRYLEELGENSLHDALDRLFGGDSCMVIVANGLQASDMLLERAAQAAIPLLSSPQPSEKLVEHLGYFLTRQMAATTTVHGVFMDVMGIGVLITGDSAVGKSELALELVSRGHYLIADDAPEFIRTAPDTLEGRCPPLLRNFLEVRGLGVLNVRAMFGDSALKKQKILRLIIRLQRMEPDALQEMDRLRGSRQMRHILDVEVPELLLPVAPGRNLAVLVEAAARNYVLYREGYDAAEAFIARQQKFIDEGQP